jgi:hypothetical protein
VAPSITTLYQDWQNDALASDPFTVGGRGAQTRALAAAILAAPVGTQIAHLTKNHGGWDAATAARADATAAAGTQEWRDALGTHQTATLTSDGRGARRDMWCECGTPGARWVRYEAYTAAGQDAHGFICPDCRGITQTG